MVVILTSGGRTSITINCAVYSVGAGYSADAGINALERPRSTRPAIDLYCSSTLPNVALSALKIKMHKVNPQDEGQ